jgi:hypothetical protein
MAQLSATREHFGSTAAMLDVLSTTVSVPLESATIFRWHLAAIAALAVAGTLVIVADLSLGYTHLFGLRPLFDLDREGNVPTMFSSLALLAAALLLALVAADDYRRGSPLRRHWMTLALGFAFLSLDEAAAVHELFNRPIRILFGSPDFAAAWIVAGAGTVIAAALAFLPFLFRIRRTTARAFVVAGFVYCAGAILLEGIGGEILSDWPRMSYPFQIEVIFEEILEMLGIALFIRALLLELRSRCVGFRLAFA